MSNRLMNDRAGLFTPGWIAQVECTGRRAELQGGEKGSLVVLLLAERAQ